MCIAVAKEEEKKGNEAKKRLFEQSVEAGREKDLFARSICRKDRTGR